MLAGHWPSLNHLSRAAATAGRYDGSVTKIVHNALAMSVDLLVAECMTLGVKAGVAMPRLVEAFGTLLPTVTTLVANHFRSVLLEVAQEHLEAVGDPSELAAARGEAGWDHS